MKKLIKAASAASLALGLVLAMVAPAAASGTEAANWLDINNPGVTCLYSYASVDSTLTYGGSTVATWSEAATVYKVNNPCAFSLGSGQSLAAGTIGVKGTLVCQWTDHGNNVITQNVWVSNGGATKYNTAGTGIVDVLNGSTVNPCNPADVIAGTLKERTIVDTYVWTGVTYAHYANTTHWVTR